MGLFSLFKRDLGNDPDLTRLRDLIIISASDSNYSLDENNVILNICRQEGIDIDKMQKLFKMDPEKIKDNYPTSLVEKSKYLRRLIEVMASDKVCYAQEIKALRSIARNMGFSDEQTDGEIRDYCKSLGKKGRRKQEQVSVLRNRLMTEPYLTQVMVPHKTALVDITTNAGYATLARILPHRDFSLVSNDGLLFCVHRNHEFVVVNLTLQMLVIKVATRIYQWFLLIGFLDEVEKVEQRVTEDIG